MTDIMETQIPVPPTFEVGGERPTSQVATISGRPFMHRELQKGEDIHLQLISVEDGEVVADAYGKVVGVAFKDRQEKDGSVKVERVHSVKVS